MFGRVLQYLYTDHEVFNILSLGQQLARLKKDDFRADLPDYELLSDGFCLTVMFEQRAERTGKERTCKQPLNGFINNHQMCTFRWCLPMIHK